MNFFNSAIATNFPREPALPPSTATTMSITQALAELKLLRKRIGANLDGTRFMMMKTKRSQVDVEKFSVDAKAYYQSYMDLLERYNKIKAAIVRSNATAVVKIAGKEYTVAEAVEKKRSIDMYKNLLMHMEKDYKHTTDEYETHCAVEEHRVERLITTELGKDAKTNVDVVKQLRETFLADNSAEIIDPLKLETKIRGLRREIEEFETAVDWTLSESNSVTMIAL